MRVAVLGGVSLGIGLLPSPCVATNVLYAQPCVPSQIPVSQTGVCIAGIDISSPARTDSVRYPDCIHLFKGIDQLQNGITLAGTEVVGV